LHLAILVYGVGYIQPQQSESPAAALARAVDLPSPAERAKAAAALAARKDVTIDEWLSAAKAFGTFTAAEAGVHREDIELWNGESPKSYEVFFFVPHKYAPGTPAPLMFALHGSDGKGDEVYPWWQPAAEELGMIVVAPTDPKAKNGYTFTEA